MTDRQSSWKHRMSRKKGTAAQTRYAAYRRAIGWVAWCTGSGYDYAADVVSVERGRVVVVSQVKAWKARPGPKVVRDAYAALQRECPFAMRKVIWAQDDGTWEWLWEGGK